MAVVIDRQFKKRLAKKSPEIAGAILECVARLADNPRHPGLNTHRVGGRAGVWEAYVDRGNRVTFHFDDDGNVVLRNHCNHDMLRKNP